MKENALKLEKNDMTTKCAKDTKTGRKAGFELFTQEASHSDLLYVIN
jgi:hypothetical protein